MFCYYALVVVGHNFKFSICTGPDLEGVHSGSCPPRWPASELFLLIRVLLFSLFFYVQGTKTKEKAYL